jgi:hypothetical protein
MTALPDRKTFENAYVGQAPWDIGNLPAITHCCPCIVMVGHLLAQLPGSSVAVPRS